MDFSGIAILVIGDVMLDHYIAGKASRVSPEAPVPVVSRDRIWTVPGGAANVARGLARLGCEARLLGIVGMDSAGAALRQEVQREGIKAGLVASERRPTICKTRVIANGQQLLRVDEETTDPPNKEERTGLILNLRKMAPGCSVIILSDYAKGVLSKDHRGWSLCVQVLELARQMDIPVLVDPKGLDWERYRGASCVTPNMKEFEEISALVSPGARSQSKGDANMQRLALRLCSDFDLDRILLTRGAAGMNLYEPGENPAHIRAVMREVADVSGAGDTVIATLAACVAKGLSWKESAIIANAAAGVAVGKPGTAPVSLAELNQAMRQNADNPKLYTLPNLIEKLRDWRRQGQKIVFSNGCFDLLHPGHVSLLRESATLGDRLIIGLNSDASVKRLKGSERPLQNEQSRAMVLAAIQSVDAVVIFEEDTPQNLIEAIKPDVLVKGSDYAPDQVVGGDYVRSYGGEVHLVNLVDGFSTTSLVEKLKKPDQEK